MLQKWQTLRSELVFDHYWYKVRRDEVKLPDGRVLDDYFVSVRPEVAVIFPVTPDNEVILVRQYKHAAGEILLEIPGGICNPGENPEKAARRELLEETGYQASKITRLATLHDDPTKNNNHFHLFLAEGVRQVQGQQLDHTEHIEVEKIPLGEITQKIVHGEIRVANSIAITFLALAKLGLR